MHRPVFLIVACTVTIVGRPGVVRAQDARATFARAVTTYKAAETIHARFEQTLTNPLTSTTSTTHGELFRQRPNLFAIVFAAPLTDRIVADGKSLWVYLPSSAPGQVIKTPASASGAGTVIDPLGQILSDSPDRYVMTDAGSATVAGRATHAVRLVPKHDSSTFTKVMLWIDDSSSVVRQIETAEPNGLTRRIVITKFVTNTPLPRSTFAFVAPVGVRVIDNLGSARNIRSGGSQ